MEVLEKFEKASVPFERAVFLHNPATDVSFYVEQGVKCVPLKQKKGISTITAKEVAETLSQYADKC